MRKDILDMMIGAGVDIATPLSGELCGLVTRKRFSKYTHTDQRTLVQSFAMEGNWDLVRFICTGFTCDLNVTFSGMYSRFKGANCVLTTDNRWNMLA